MVVVRQETLNVLYFHEGGVVFGVMSRRGPRAGGAGRLTSTGPAPATDSTTTGAGAAGASTIGAAGGGRGGGTLAAGA